MLNISTCLTYLKSIALVIKNHIFLTNRYLRISDDKKSEMTAKGKERILRPLLKAKDCLTTKNQMIREFLAELFGTWILVVFIAGSSAQNVFFKRDGYESLLSVNLTVGFGVTLAALAVGKVSGNN